MGEVPKNSQYIAKRFLKTCGKILGIFLNFLNFRKFFLLNIKYLFRPQVFGARVKSTIFSEALVLALHFSLI